MNVVIHAYPGDEDGLLEVDAVTDLDGLTIVVRDHGSGIRPRPDVEQPSLRIGLTLIAALSSSFEISGGVDRGTEIRMHLPMRPRAEDSEAADRAAQPAAEATKMRVGPPELVGPVLSRVVGALAARHKITVDRLSDAIRSLAERHIDIELPEVGSLATLADVLRVEEGDEGEFLVVGISSLAT